MRLAPARATTSFGFAAAGAGATFAGTCMLLLSPVCVISSSSRRLRRSVERRIRIRARRRLGTFSIEPDIDGLRIEKKLTLQQPCLLDILIPGTQKSQSAALRQKHHKVFGPFHHYPHDVSDVRDEKSRGHNLAPVVGLEARDFRLQNRHDHIQKSAAARWSAAIFSG